MIRSDAWTEAEKRELSGYLRAGMSAGQIAKLMPDRTRNAVIGLVHRDRDLAAIGFKGSVGFREGNCKGNPGKTVSIASRRRKNVRGGKPKKIIQSVPRSGEVIPMKPRPKPQPKPVQPDYVEIGAKAYDADALVVGSLPVSNAHCKWPIGDPKAEGFGFCKHLRLEGKPYCQHHKDRATRVVFRSEKAA